MMKNEKTYFFLYFFTFILIAFFCSSCGGGGNEDTIIPDTNQENTLIPDGADDLLPESAQLKFNISNCIGIVKIDPSKVSGKRFSTVGENTTTPLKGVNSDGTLSEITNKNIPVKDFYISNTGDLYLLLNSKFTYIDENEEEKNSILFKINPDNTYESVDNSLDSVSSSNDSLSSVIGNPVIQFDNDGAIYYSGNANNNTVLRKNLNGTISELINSNISLRHWFVTPDGNIFIEGTTESTSTRWFRKITNTGSIQNLISSGSNLLFIKLFPDNKIYFGDWGKLLGVGKIATSDTELFEPCLIGSNSHTASWCAPAGLLGTDNEDCDLCTDAGFSCSSIDCGLAEQKGVWIRGYFKTYFNEVYVIVCSSISGNRVWKYYPEVEFINLTLAKDIKIMKGLLSSLVVYGLNSSQQNKFILYDISSKIETDLLPDDDVEIYHINIRADGKIWFDGLRFSDNKYVIGFVDTSNSNQIVFLSATNLQLEDFKTF